MFVFVLIHDCINSYCEWNFLLKKIFFILFNNKNRFDFFVIKNDFFLSSQNISKFLSSKTTFSTYYKTNQVFWQIKINFFTNQK